MKKQLLKLIMAVMAAVMLAGCGSGSVDNNITQDTSQQSTQNNNYNNTTTPVDIPLNYWGRPLYEVGSDGELRPTTAGFREIPKDLRGREVTLLLGHLPNSQAWSNFNYWEEIDRTPNETISIMEKMRQIEADYNLTFTNEIAERGSGLRSQLMLAQLAGDTPWDIMVIGTGHLSLDGVFPYGLLMDMNHPTIKNIIDLEGNPWKVESELTRMVGRQFGVHFPIANSGDMLRSMLTFNKDHAQTLGLGNLFDMVWNKTWTFDNFESILSQISRNSDGQIIPLLEGWGGNLAVGLIGSNNGRIAEHTSEGGMRFVAHECDNALGAMDFLQRIISAGFLTIEPGDRREGIVRMADGEAVFLTGSYENLRIFTRQEFPTEFSFGLLPFPMGAAANDFVSTTPHAEFYSILANIERPEEIAAVIVAMANRLTKLNIVETELNYGLQDMESARVLEYMLDRVVLDFSSITGVRHNVGSALNGIISLQQTPRQAFEMIAPIVQINYDNMHFRESQ